MQNYKLQKRKTSDIQSFITKRTEIKVKNNTENSFILPLCLLRLKNKEF